MYKKKNGKPDAEFFDVYRMYYSPGYFEREGTVALPGSCETECLLQLSSDGTLSSDEYQSIMEVIKLNG